MRRCARCGDMFPILTAADRRCPQCAREVEAIVRADAERRLRRRFTPRDLTADVLGHAA